MLYFSERVEKSFLQKKNEKNIQFFFLKISSIFSKQNATP